MRRVLRLLPAAVLLAGAGCQSDERVPVYPVSGQVIYDGKPAAGVQVYFYPTSAPMMPRIPNNPHAVTGPDGRFRLTTYDEGDGAAEGGYQVLLLWPRDDASEDPEEGADRLLDWYDIKHSKLTAQVKTGANDLPPFKLPAVTKPPEAVAGVPGRN